METAVHAQVHIYNVFLTKAIFKGNQRFTKHYNNQAETTSYVTSELYLPNHKTTIPLPPQRCLYQYKCNPLDWNNIRVP